MNSNTLFKRMESNDAKLKTIERAIRETERKIRVTLGSIVSLHDTLSQLQKLAWSDVSDIQVFTSTYWIKICGHDRRSVMLIATPTIPITNDRIPQQIFTHRKDDIFKVTTPGHINDQM